MRMSNLKGVIILTQNLVMSQMLMKYQVRFRKQMPKKIEMKWEKTKKMVIFKRLSKWQYIWLGWHWIRWQWYSRVIQKLLVNS